MFRDTNLGSLDQAVRVNELLDWIVLQYVSMETIDRLSNQLRSDR